ncbi:hypothetical protein JJL45_03430 [Tamlana sp. s12]|uniref:DUF5687 family protein n=1 Tax=Tamlana sp. s12 TaxID=1630406 RepID=UPI0007FF5083|nr:DUF5687 family protein [Tamlana sp. s12]OBQ54952.1 membrane protein [Tamlana sp. s12]QQY83058.1 hypothetical protein JJL45_03430 [Tamlana sp. s12]
MLKLFLGLEWKSFFRSASFGKTLGLKIIMGFFALYFIVMFLSLGISAFFILKETYPNQEPLFVVNSYLFYWFLGDLVMRFFFQKLPVMSVKPLLTVPIKRNKIVNYVLWKSTVAFFNFLPLFAVIPFGLTLIFNGYPTGNVIIWMLALLLLTLIVNLLNFIIESLSAQNELSALPIVVICSVLFGLDYFQILSISNLFGQAFYAIYESPIFIVVPILVLGVLYRLNFKMLRQKLYLDSGLKTRVEEVKSSNLEWTNYFGDMAPFMRLDLKLIWRNKRTKSSVWMLLLGLFYGLFFYTNEKYINAPWMYIFIGVFSTGSFLINFGQFIPAWDSTYYKLLMSQNIKYEKYLKSKFTLMALSVIILFVLGIPYVYFGWKILLAHFASAIYNVGVNTHVMLYGGSYNRKKIDLNQKAAFNYQGTGAMQWLIGIPLLVVPMVIFGLLYYFLNFEYACAIIAGLGVIGIVLHDKLLGIITSKYLKSKYEMIHAFEQDN